MKVNVYFSAYIMHMHSAISTIEIHDSRNLPNVVFPCTDDNDDDDCVEEELSFLASASLLSDFDS